MDIFTPRRSIRAFQIASISFDISNNDVIMMSRDRSDKATASIDWRMANLPEVGGFYCLTHDNKAFYLSRYNFEENYERKDAVGVV